MATLPSASVVIDDSAGGYAGNVGYVVVMSCVGRNADNVPRVMASAKGILSQYDYSQGADYAAIHIEETKKPVIFVGLPIATAGVIGRINSSGVTGSSAISVAAGSAGPLEEVKASFTVVGGGTVGTSSITGLLSLDDGWTMKLVRVGTASSYTIPYVNLTLNFGAGTLNAGDVYTFTTTAPMWDSAGLTAARTALAAQLNAARSWMICGDVANSTFAGFVTSAVDTYETANARFVYARTSIKDRQPLAAMSKVLKTMTGAPNLTFAAAGFTVTRSAGSFVSDGFVVGDVVTFAGSASNNFTGALTGVTATVLTFASGVVNEGPVASVTCVGSNGITFAAAGFTVTRSAGGSWLNDGFAVGDSITFAGTSSNNTTLTATAVSATVLTFASGIANEGPKRSDLLTVTTGQTTAAYVSAQSTAFASVDGEKRIDLSLGRARRLSPITAWSFRRPAAWALSVREYKHDVQIPAWRKADQPLSGWDMTDGNGKVIEFDQRTDGGALEGRFSCLRTYGNGPNGAYGALSLTRAIEASLLSRTHNLAVANIACAVVQAETENAIGQVLILNADGTGTTDSLKKIEERINSALQRELLQDKGEGPRASSAVWSASRTDILNVIGASLTGTLALKLNGTLEQITTVVRVS